MLPLYFAPLQGFTEDTYRRIHHELVGGITAYYTPFLRLEHKGIRTKDARDVRPEFALQHARPPCPSPTPGVHRNPCP